MGNKLVRLFPIHFPAVVTAVQCQITVIPPVPCGSGYLYYLYFLTIGTTHSPTKMSPCCKQPMQAICPENVCLFPLVKIYKL